MVADTRDRLDFGEFVLDRLPSAFPNNATNTGISIDKEKNRAFQLILLLSPMPTSMYAAIAEAAGTAHE